MLSYGQNSPLALLAMKRDGTAYLRMWRVSYLVGILGLNELVEKKKKPPVMMFLEQFRDFMILVLIAAAVI